jgi:hypothetical protein
LSAHRGNFLLRWLDAAFGFLFGCRHKRRSWVYIREDGSQYVSCLECGAEIDYDLVRFEQRTRRVL